MYRPMLVVFDLGETFGNLCCVRAFVCYVCRRKPAVLV